jgi:hypothetical protein
MKSDFFNRGKWVLGLAFSLFSLAALADNHVLEPTWVKPDTDFTQFNKFLVKPLIIDDVKIVRPPWAQDDPKEWALEFEDLEAIQAIFRDAMNDILEADGGYPVVYSAGADVLEVEVEVLSIMPYVRPGSSGTSGGHEIITLGSGEIAGSTEIRNSQTRELLLLMEGERVAGEEYKQWTLENNIANLTKLFRSFASRLRSAMDEVHGK